MFMKKKLSALILSSIAALSVCGLAACGDDVSDTDDGKVTIIAVAESSATDVKGAIDGYIAAELAHRSAERTEYVGHTSKGDVALDDITLENDDKTGLISVEKYAVTVDIEYIRYESVEEVNVTQTMYVLKYDDGYKYAAAEPVVGEGVTNSYIKSLLDYTKYANCTATHEVYCGQAGQAEEFGHAEVFEFDSDTVARFNYYDEGRYKARTPSCDKAYDVEADNGKFDRLEFAIKKGEELFEAYFDYNPVSKKIDWFAERSDRSLAERLRYYITDDDRLFGIIGYIPAALLVKTKNGMGCTFTSEGETEVYECTVSGGRVIGGSMSHTDSTDSETHRIALSKFGSTTVNVPAQAQAAIDAIE